MPYWNFEYTKAVIYTVVKVGGGTGQDPATEVTHLRLNQPPVFSSVMSELVMSVGQSKWNTFPCMCSTIPVGQEHSTALLLGATCGVRNVKFDVCSVLLHCAQSDLCLLC